ncbi:MAG: dimethylarginine dimethylaminohydrolase family protein [Weeksellaceae bacterium]
MKEILLCPPTNFEIMYEINPWMHAGTPIDHVKILEEYEALKQIYTSLGVTYHELTPQVGLPDQVYTTDTGLPEGNMFIKSNFRYPQRVPEAAIAASFFQKKGYENKTIPDGIYFEGEGELLRCDDRYYLGYGYRSSKEAAPYLQDYLQKPVQTLEIVDPRFFHLDTCFAPLTDDLALVYKPALSKEAQQVVQRDFKSLINLTETDALAFACNLVTIGKNIIIHEGLSDSLTKQLEEQGYTIHTLNMQEYLKGGGSAKCISLQIYK